MKYLLKFNSIHWKLTASFFLIILLITIIIGTISIEINKSAAQSAINYGTQAICNEIAEEVYIFFSSVKEQVFFFSISPVFQTLQPKIIDTEIKRIRNFAKNQYFSLYYLADKNGKTIYNSSVDRKLNYLYDGLEKINSGLNIYFSPIYLLKNDPRQQYYHKSILASTIVVGVKTISGKIKGYLGVEVILEPISNSIRRIQLGKTGKAKLINNNGEIIKYIYKYEDWTSATVVNNKEFSEVINNVITGKLESGAFYEKTSPISSELKSEEMKQVLASYVSVKISENNFIGILIDQEVEEAYQMSKHIVNTTILVGVLCIFLSMGVAYFISKSISSPLILLASSAEQIANGNFDSRAIIKTHDEVGKLSDSFNRMTKQLKASFNEIEEKNEFLISVTNSLTHPFYVIDVKSHKVILANKYAYIDAKSKKEYYKYIHDENGTHKEYIDIVDKVKKIKDYYIMEKTITDKDGLDTYLELYGFPIFNKNKQVVQVILYFLDITARKTAEKEKEKFQAHFIQSQKMQTVGTLAGGLAHDFNNVLSGITGTVSLIKYDLETKDIDIDGLKEDIHTIEESSVRATEMVKQLLALSKKHDLSFSAIDLNESIKHVLKICKNTFDKSIELVGTYTKEPAIINADTAQIEQVLLNLCVNASHAMTIMKKENEKRGGRLIVSIERVIADKHFIEVHREAYEQPYWLVRVIDTGVGIDPKIKSQIFDPFFTTKENIKGTGLGLAMVYNIIQQHKGFIDVYSEPGKGSTFNIYIPIMANVDKISPKEKKEIISTKNKGLILLIDDEEKLRELGKRILNECGYNVLLAHNGIKGIEIYKENHKNIDAVLLDMAMPKLSGKETYKELRKIDPEVKVLLVSGYKQDERVQESLRLGVKGFIQKPYTMYQLAKKIEEIILE